MLAGVARVLDIINRDNFAPTHLTAVLNLRMIPPVAVTHKDFMTMLAPMFPPKSTHQDMMAIMKRSFAYIFGENRIYMRKPLASTKATVKVFRYWPERERA